MKKLSLVIMELLAISLGVERSHYRDFFEDSCSIMRCNYYPPCQEPELTLGTGPHCDPTSLTILQQDQVEGLEVFSANKWRSIRPIRDALVINIGDTFMVRNLLPLFLSIDKTNSSGDVKGQTPSSNSAELLVDVSSSLPFV